MARSAWKVVLAFFIVTWIFRGLLAIAYTVMFFQAAPSMQLNLQWPFALSTTAVYGTILWKRGIRGMGEGWAVTWFATVTTAAIHLSILRLVREEPFEFDRFALNLTPWMITLAISVGVCQVLSRRLIWKGDSKMDAAVDVK